MYLNYASVCFDIITCKQIECFAVNFFLKMFERALFVEVYSIFYGSIDG